MRHREESSGSIDAVQYTWTRTSGGSPISPIVTYGGESRFRSIDDVSTPNFRCLQKCGEILPQNPVRIATVKRTRTPGSGSFTITVKPSGPVVRTGSGSITEYGMPVQLYELPSTDGNLVNSVAVAALANARAVEWDVLTFLAELHKTHTTVVSLFKRLSQGLEAMADAAARVARGPSEAHKLFGNYWLEGRYGIRPIVYDLQSAVDAFMKSAVESPLKRGRGFNERTFTKTNSYVRKGMGDTGCEDRYGVETMTWSQQYRGFAIAQITHPYSQRFNLDPFSTGWEVIPWSFVIDHFVNIGAWLRAIAPNASSVIAYGPSASIKTVYRYEQQRWSNWRENDAKTHIGSGSWGVSHYVEEGEIYERTGVLPVLYPPVNFRIDWKFLIDLMFLATKTRSEIYRRLNRGEKMLSTKPWPGGR